MTYGAQTRSDVNLSVGALASVPEFSLCLCPPPLPLATSDLWFLLPADIWEHDLVELVLEVPVSQVSHRQRDMLLRQVGVLLGVLDSDIIVREISAFNEHRWDFFFFQVIEVHHYSIRLLRHRSNICPVPLLSLVHGWSSWCQVGRGALRCQVTVLHSAYATNCASRRMTFSFTRLDGWIQSVSTAHTNIHLLPGYFPVSVWQLFAVLVCQQSLLYS